MGSETVVKKPRGRPSRTNYFAHEYSRIFSSRDFRGARIVLGQAKSELCTTSMRKLLSDLCIPSVHPRPGRPERIAIFRKACVSNFHEGKPEFIGSILDYARTKLSRSSYFKLKRELSELGVTWN